MHLLHFLHKCSFYSIQFFRVLAKISGMTVACCDFIVELLPFRDACIVATSSRDKTSQNLTGRAQLEDVNKLRHLQLSSSSLHLECEVQKVRAQMGVTLCFITGCLSRLSLPYGNSSHSWGGRGGGICSAGNYRPSRWWQSCC